MMASTPLVSAPIDAPVSTGADTQSSMLIHSAKTSRNHHVWQQLINRTLLRWLENPTLVEDEYIAAPSRQIIRLALDLAERCRDSGIDAPDRIVPDPNGGFVFERMEDSRSEVLHVWDDGSVEYMHFVGTRLVERRPVRF